MFIGINLCVCRTKAVASAIKTTIPTILHTNRGRSGKKMAASRHLTDPSTNVPDYEYQDVNTKPFHIGSFRAEWLKRLKPSDYSYQVEDEDTFDAKFAQELGVDAETMVELKSICK